METLISMMIGSFENAKDVIKFMNLDDTELLNFETGTYIEK